MVPLANGAIAYDTGLNEAQLAIIYFELSSHKIEEISGYPLWFIESI